ncbi:MAG: hypothetical protein RLZZ171_1615, partial [Cyanobacteriota bacterium]
RMKEFWRDDVTILLVSHSMNMICENCHKVIWMEQGRVKMIGQTQDVIDQYLECVAPTSTTSSLTTQINQ